MNALRESTFDESAMMATALAGEALTTREWATLLGVTSRAVQVEKLAGEMRQVRGGLTKVIPFGNLPERWQAQLSGLREKHAASSYGSLLSMQAVETRWVPQREWMSYPEATRERAMKKKTVALVYFAAEDAGRIKTEANLLARAEWLKQFAKACNEKTIRRLVADVEQCGGIDFVPDEAFCDDKSVPHPNARRMAKLGIPVELVEWFKANTTTVEHMTAAYRKFEIDWLMGRPVPGLGSRQGDQRFPFTFEQLRPFAASTPARQLGSHGKARARRESLPYRHTSTAALRRSELYMLDDTRIDIVATDDLTGKPVELKSYWMLDVGPRRIEGFILREAGAIKQNDVDTLVARVLRSSGIAAAGAGYTTTIKFERGTTACSPAKQSFLEGAFPGRVNVDRTGVDGGKNFAGDFNQSHSGHWMGKSHIESFMRTVAYFLEHIPGQRGGVYRKQPAQLGLQGHNRETNLLGYDAGSQIHEAALLEYAGRAMEWIETGEVVNGTRVRRLKIEALIPVSWVMEALKEFVAYYNQRTDHRMEGFARIESQDPETGKLSWRVESPNERAAILDRLCPAERISASDAACLLQMSTKAVMVNKNGVTFDLKPFTGLNFWKEGSMAVCEALRLATCEKKFTAVFDAEAILQWTPQSDYTLEIHLLTGTPGEPGCRYLESLPLCKYADRSQPQDIAKELAAVKRAQGRYAAELLRATAPILGRKLTEAESNVVELQGAVTTMNQTREAEGGSELLTRIEQAASRAEQRETERALREADAEKQAARDLEF